MRRAVENLLGVIRATRGPRWREALPTDAHPAAGKRVGVAKGNFKVPDDIDAHNDEVAKALLGEKKS